MGAATFVTIANGSTASEAFRDAREEARYEYGHRGYTGSIAEKDEFTSFGTAPSVAAAELVALDALDHDDPRILDKWGPAGCVAVECPGEPRAFVFFGWASS